MLKAFFGALAALALAAALVGGLVVVFAPGPSAETPRTRTVPAQQIGETLKTGDVAWRVTGLRQSDSISTYTFPPTTRHGDYLTVDFMIKNTSDVPITLNPEAIALSHGDGDTMVADPTINAGYVEYERNVLFNKNGIIEPQESVRGRVNFDVGLLFERNGPTNAKLLLRNTDPTTPGHVSLDLNLAPL